MVKRILSAVLATAIALGTLTGCGKQSSEINGDTTELTLHMHFFGYCVYDENWPIFKKAAELTGVTLKGTASESISDSSQAWNTMVASKTLPDIIHGTSSQLNELGKMGGMIPLEDLIDKYCPNIKKFFEEYPPAKAEATASDGHIYYIPGSLSGVDKEAVTSKGFFIRTDWLEKLGLKEPKTVDEMYKVLTAFKTQDPNGNGQQDEIPYFVRQEGITDLLQLFDAYYGWHELKDGTVSYGRTEESYKEAMKQLAKWYKEGLIDKEIYSRGGQARQQLLSQDLGGMTHDWISSTSKYGETYNIGWKTMLPPADINGVVKEVRSRSTLHGEGWGISKDNKHIETTMKYFDFWMSQVGRDLNAFGVEGVHYNVINGEKIFTDEVLNAQDGVPTYMRNQGQVEIGTVGSIQAEYQGMCEEGKRGFDLYEDAGIVLPEGVGVSFTDEEQTEKASMVTDIETYVKEMEQKWLFGIEDVDATWDTYIKTIKDMGYDRVLELYNIAHKRHLENQ